uniref:Uncharacterized protein n=1 Tax=Solanum lycopersicum TaxID=4081 RepID=A0A3Q7G873_SOLLC
MLLSSSLDKIKSIPYLFLKFFCILLSSCFVLFLLNKDSKKLGTLWGLYDYFTIYNLS